MRIPAKISSKLLLFTAPVLLAVGGAQAQYGNSNYYNGVRSGYGRGGYDYDHRHDRRDYDRNRNYHQGGIGPGKGALIGGAGGAALGAVFGGGLKGALIGGGAGAGIGAIAGKAHQDHVRDRDGYYRR